MAIEKVLFFCKWCTHSLESYKILAADPNRICVIKLKAYDLKVCDFPLIPLYWHKAFKILNHLN